MRNGLKRSLKENSKEFKEICCYQPPQSVTGLQAATNWKVFDVNNNNDIEPNIPNAGDEKLEFTDHFSFIACRSTLAEAKYLNR